MGDGGALGLECRGWGAMLGRAGWVGRKGWAVRRGLGLVFEELKRLVEKSVFLGWMWGLID